MKVLGLDGYSLTSHTLHIRQYEHVRTVYCVLFWNKGAALMIESTQDRKYRLDDENNISKTLHDHRSLFRR